MNCPECNRPLIHLMSDCLFCAQQSYGWPPRLNSGREQVDFNSLEAEINLDLRLAQISVAPEAIKAEIDQQYPETNFDLRLGREQVRIPAMLTYRNLSISGAAGTGKTRMINSLLQQVRTMASQKCVIVDINGCYYSRFGRPGDKVLSVSSHQSEAWNFSNENVYSEFFAETLAEVNQNHRFFSEGDQALSTFSLRRWATSPSNDWVFLSMGIKELAEFGPLLRLWFELAILGVLQRDVGSDHPHLWLIADELPALGRIPSLTKLLAETRKYKASVIAAYQLSAQLQNIYGRAAAKVITQGLENKIRFRNPEPSSAMESSIELGLPTASEIQNLPDFQAYLKICGFAPTRIQMDVLSPHA